MLTLRATGRLLKRAKIDPEPKPPHSTGKLGDWYATLLEVRPVHVVLCTCEATRLPVLVPAKDLARLPERVVEGVGNMLRAIGVAEADVEEELDHMCEIRFAKTANRGLQGTMSDYLRMFGQGSRFTGKPRSFLEKSLELAESPCVVLGTFPIGATRALFKRPRLRLVK
ncbi:MAG TPA: hypothetical protein VGK67_20030 [Myxococcales bacterium]